MVDSHALRNARYRSHRRGDHTLCLPDRCPAAGEVGVSVTTPIRPGRPAASATQPPETPAEQNRRRYWHSRGDHTLCSIDLCTQATPPHLAHAWKVAAAVNVDDALAAAAASGGWVDVPAGSRVDALDVVCATCGRPYDDVADQPCQGRPPGAARPSAGRPRQ